MKGIWKSRIEVYRNVFLDEDEFRYSWVEYAAGSQFTRKGIEFTREYDDWVNLEVTSGTASMVKDVTFSSDEYNRIATRVKRNSGSWGIWLWDSGAGSWYKPFDLMTESGFFEASLPAGKTYTRVLVLVQGTPGTFDSDFDYVTIYKEDVIISKAERIYFKDEINEAIPVSTIELGLPKETEPKVGDLIKLYLAKETGSMVKIQVGKISFKKEVEKEKFKDIEITVMSKARAALDKLVTHDVKRDDWKVLLDDVTAPLVDKTLVYFETRGDSQTVTMQKAKGREIFSQLKSLAKLAELDMITTPTGETIYVYKESFFNSAIESLSPYPDAIYDLEYDVDDKRIKNIVNLEANYVIEKNNTLDGYSDSLTGWYGYKDVGGTWEVNNPTLSNYPAAGTYSIHIRGTECYGLWLVRDLEKQLDLERGYLNFQNSGNDARQTLVPWFLRGGTWTETHVYLMEDVASSPPSDNYARRRIPFPGKTNVSVSPPRPEFSENKMPLGQREDAWEVSNFDWDKAKGLGFLIRPKSGWWDNELAILDYFVDELNLSQLRIATSYVVQSSIDLYGERELPTKNYYPELSSLEEMEEKAKSLIDPIAYPEESIRSLKCRRVLDTYPGRAIYSDIPGKEGNYFLQSIEYTLEDVYLETTVTLSKSIVEEPVRTKEIAFIDTRRRIKELEEKVAVLETDVAAYTEARELLGASPTSQSGGNLKFNVGFDWASIAQGVNNLISAAISQAFGGNWQNLVISLGTFSGGDITADSIIASKLKSGIQPFNSDVAFTPKAGDEHDSISWSAGTITFADGGAQSIDAGESLNMTAGVKYIYFTVGSTSLTVTTTYSDTIGDTKGLLAVIEISSDTTQEIMIQPFYSKGLNIIADVIAANAILATHIAAGAIESDHILAGNVLTKHLYVWSHLIDGVTWTNNAPTDSISWNAHKLYYKGTEYSISADTCDVGDRYIYWTGGTSYLHTVAKPSLDTLGIDGALIAYNENGVAREAIRATMIRGNYIATGSIYADEIAANAITAEKIYANAVETAKLGLSRVTSDPSGSGGEMWYRTDTKKLMFRKDATTVAEIPVMREGGIVQKVVEVVDMVEDAIFTTLSKFGEWFPFLSWLSPKTSVHTGEKLDWTNHGYDYFVFGSGSASILKDGFQMNTGTTDGSFAYVYEGSNVWDFAKNPWFACYFRFLPEAYNTGSYAFIRLRTNSYYIGLLCLNNGTSSIELKGQVNSASGSTTISLGTYDAFFYRALKVENRGTSVKFYIDGALKGTITTNIPTTGSCKFVAGVDDNLAGYDDELTIRKGPYIEEKFV